jgi:DNA polymerase-4
VPARGVRPRPLRRLRRGERAHLRRVPFVHALVEGISLDEAFLDVAGARRLFGTPHDIAGEIRRRVFDETGLTCSVGGSTTKFIAKLASEAAKPSASFSGPVPGLGVKIVEPGDELAFLHPLPVQALWGVGPATLAKLERYGLRTVGDLAALSVETLVGAVGDSHGRQLHALAWARDERVVVSEQRAKSIGHEETYAEDKHERADLAREAVRMGDAVASRLRKHGVAGRTVTIKVRFHDFQTITRSHTLAAPVDTGHAIAQVASALLEQVDPSSGVRLFGVSVSNLQEGAAQLTLDDTGWGRATAAVDDIRERFGDAAVGPAALVDAAGRLRVKRRGEQQWGPGRDGGTAT